MGLFPAYPQMPEIWKWVLAPDLIFVEMFWFF